MQMLYIYNTTLFTSVTLQLYIINFSNNNNICKLSYFHKRRYFHIRKLSDDLIDRYKIPHYTKIGNSRPKINEIVNFQFSRIFPKTRFQNKKGKLQTIPEFPLHHLFNKSNKFQ